MENIGRRTFLGMTALVLGAAYFPSAAFGDETEIFKTSAEFKNKLKIPRNLADFLESKRCEILLEDAGKLQVTDKGEKIGNASSGIYFQDINRIYLIRNHSETIKFHEIGHALWDPHGNDGIFDSYKYRGPTRGDFSKTLKTTETYPLILRDFSERYQNQVIAERVAIDETFAAFFEAWMQERNFIEKRIPLLFNAMTYRERGLKSN